MSIALLHKIYNLSIRLLGAGLRMAAPFNAKAQESIRGRRAARSALDAFASRAKGKKKVWVHCASLGEFEQGRPVIERMRETYPETEILLTFFSPSGYRMRKNFAAAGQVSYMLLDTPGNARQFLETVKPDLAVFIKYEFWLNHLIELRRRKIPVLLAAAVFHRKQPFFGIAGKLFRQVLPWYERIFVQNEDSGRLLEELGVKNHVVAGDTRIDRVAQIAARVHPIPEAAAFAGNSPVLVVGSSWPADERILQPLLDNGLPDAWKVIIAPHEIDEAHLQSIEKRVNLPAVRFSRAGKADLAEVRCLLIDNIGMLSRLYRYGRLAYVGGGFGAGIHNTLEPLAFGLPVIIGPRYEKFGEAVEMVSKGAMFSVQNADDLVHTFTGLLQAENYEQARGVAKAFIESNRGATETIMNHIAQRQLL